MTIERLEQMIQETIEAVNKQEGNSSDEEFGEQSGGIGRDESGSICSAA